MGCGASVNKRAANSKNASHPAGQKLKAQETAIEGLSRVYDFVFFTSVRECFNFIFN